MGRCDSTRVGEGRKGRIILVIRSQSTDGTGEGGKRTPDLSYDQEGKKGELPNGIKQIGILFGH